MTTPAPGAIRLLSYFRLSYLLPIDPIYYDRYTADNNKQEYLANGLDYYYKGVLSALGDQVLPSYNNLVSIASKHVGIQAFYKLIRKENLYSGNNKDILYKKLPALFETARAVGIPASQIYLALVYILKGQARRFYYRLITGRKATFAQIVAILRKEFETEYRREHIQTE